MSLFAIKNDKGEWLYSDEYNDWVDQLYLASFYDTFEDADDDIECRGLSNAYVVELVEAPAKVVVSEAESEMLEKAKDTTVWRPAAVAVISDYAYNAAKDSDQEALLEDRLMRAYVIGWTVEKPKLFLVKVPHTDDSYFYKIDDEYCNAGDSYHLEGMTDKKWFTIAEIEHYELTDCEKVLCADSARTTGEVTEDDD